MLEQVQFQQIQSIIDNDKKAIRRLRRIKRKALVRLVIKAKRDKLGMKVLELKEKFKKYIEEDC